MQQVIRRLAVDDAEAVAQLERDARAALLDQRGGPAHLAERPPVGKWAALADCADRPVWVSTIDDVVLGYIELEIAGDTARVMQVYVEPEAREIGFGDWMLEAAIEEARSRACTVIEGFALPGDRATKNLYERAGITARKITVSKSL
ncbi:MAG: GNAT family N-acetyltransferase [Actinomycetia bacterium]|nr:GNAT family N-acetyltransferase [Actinomycetes bacterium]